MGRRDYSTALSFVCDGRLDAPAYSGQKTGNCGDTGEEESVS